MTLQQWLQSWPSVGRHYYQGMDISNSAFTPVPDGRHAYVVADHSHGARTQAFDLEDYRVSSVSGGSLWFLPKVERSE